MYIYSVIQFLSPGTQFIVAYAPLLSLFSVAFASCWHLVVCGGINVVQGTMPLVCLSCSADDANRYYCHCYPAPREYNFKK